MLPDSKLLLNINYPSNLGIFADAFPVKSRSQDSDLLLYLEKALSICWQILGMIKHIRWSRSGVVGRKYTKKNINQVYDELVSRLLMTLLVKNLHTLKFTHSQVYAQSVYIRSVYIRLVYTWSVYIRQFYT